MSIPLLDVRHLCIRYTTGNGPVPAVRDVSFHVQRGECLALVGETGCGKSTLALGLLGLLDPAHALTGNVVLEGRQLVGLSKSEWRQVHGTRIGMVFQNSQSAFNPVLTVRQHLFETLRSHRKLSRREAHGRARALLSEVGIAEPDRCLKLYPHELSGGMCQRVGIALAICQNPCLLIADEPTSALDPTIQAQVLELLRTLQQRHGLAVLLISHDLPMVQEYATRIAVMYHGRMVECGPAGRVTSVPGHPYTQALLNSGPRLQHTPNGPPLAVIPGTPLSATESGTGCDFAPRCGLAEPQCRTEQPQGFAITEDHWATCHLLHK